MAQNNVGDFVFKRLGMFLRELYLKRRNCFSETPECNRNGTNCEGTGPTTSMLIVSYPPWLEHKRQT